MSMFVLPAFIYTPSITKKTWKIHAIFGIDGLGEGIAEVVWILPLTAVFPKSHVWAINGMFSILGFPEIFNDDTEVVLFEIVVNPLIFNDDNKVVLLDNVINVLPFDDNNKVHDLLI